MGERKKVRVQLPNLLLDEIDCFVSVPVLKVHVMTTVTLSIKNLWGCLPDTMRMFQHPNFDRNVTLIAKSIKPKIAVIDGIYGLDKHGPTYGEPVRMDLIITSDNMVVADALGASVMGFSPKQIGKIRMAEKEGLGTTNLEEVRINTDWRTYKRQFHIERTFLDKISILPFKSTFVAKVIFDSPLRPTIYRVVDMLIYPESKIAKEKK